MGNDHDPWNDWKKLYIGIPVVHSVIEINLKRVG